MGVEKTKAKLKLDKPIFLGMTILDISKLHMYQFYYDVLKKKYHENIELVYTDTDSYVIQTFIEDIYKDFKGLNQYMDFSDYPPAMTKRIRKNLVISRMSATVKQ